MKKQHFVFCMLDPGAMAVQLMSELVRKAEADIDGLRRRLAGLGAAGELRIVPRSKA